MQAITSEGLGQRKPSVLILTAGFGEGHNSAARSLAEALNTRAAEAVMVETVDLFEDAAPVSGGIYKWAYCQLINHLPWLWRWIFRLSRKSNFADLRWDRFVGLSAALAERLNRHRPQLVVSTYPIYPWFLQQLAAGVHRPEQNLVVITDSITIHPVWNQPLVDCFYVTDEFSRDVMANAFSRPVEVQVSGFPVSRDFSRGCSGVLAEAPGTGRVKVLYFATTSRKHVRATLRGLLQHLPDGSRLTVVMGRHEERLLTDVKELTEVFTGIPVSLIGWTRNVPELMLTHDVVISKAGGATVHECFAAAVPVLINYIIPGQEEGNADLLERLGCGRRSLVPEQTGVLLASLIMDGRLQEMKKCMAGLPRADGAMLIAADILNRLGKGDLNKIPVAGSGP